MTAADHPRSPLSARTSAAGDIQATSQREMQPEIWQLGAAEMARRIQGRELSAVEAVEACIGRIREVDERLNAVVAQRFDEARREAAAVDQALKQGQPQGPLAGVPITIKECFFVAGLPATLGLTRHAGDIASTDGAPVARLRQAGAIVLGVTNVPQAMLNHECDNPLYGRTNNPWNLERTSGGSSGGEGAIIAAGGSPLGPGQRPGRQHSRALPFLRHHGHYAHRAPARPGRHRAQSARAGGHSISARADGAPNVEDLQLALCTY